MGRNPERDAKAMAARKQKILAASFKVFSSKGIDSVSMNDVAKGCKIGTATLYRHYTTKPKLAVAVAAWTWETVIRKYLRQAGRPQGSGAEMLAAYVDAMTDLCRRHPDALRYLQFFQVYARNEKLLAEEKAMRAGTVEEMMEQFHIIYAKAQEDGSVRTDEAEDEMFAFIINTVLTNGSRICSGLACVDGPNNEGELVMMRNMILRNYTV